MKIPMLQRRNVRIAVVVILVWFLIAPWAALPAASAPPGKVPADWIKLSAGAKFDLMAPPGSAYVPRRGIDSAVGRIEAPNFALDFDYGAYSDSLGPSPDYQEYQVRQVEIDGKVARIVTAYGPARSADRPYFIGIHFPNLGRSVIGPVRLSMGALLATPEAYGAIETMFATITFK